MSLEKICVVGLGYIGLPTAAIFAQHGRTVLGVDVNESIVEMVNSGVVHINEPNLDQMVMDAVESGRLTASKTPAESDVFLIAVPTPFKGEREPDLQHVESAAVAIANVVKRGDLVILESTSPVGTTEKLAEIFKRCRPELSFGDEDVWDVDFVYCPERVLPGNILEELKHNSRIFGGVTYAGARRAADLYQSFVSGEIEITDSKTAEMTKLTENTFRDVNIALANELSIVCDEIGINVMELINLANKHPRVDVLQPGPGVGGHCIAVDPWFIVDASPENTPLISAARRVNDKKPGWVVQKIMRSWDECIQQAKPEQSSVTIGCLGLTYKANVSDLRHSPSLQIARALSENTGSVVVGDPCVPEGTQLSLDIRPWEEVIRVSDILVVLVDHSEFRAVDFETLDAEVFDFRG